VVKDGVAKVFTRNGNDAETYFPKLLTKATWIECEEAIVDGEVVAIGEDGTPDFSLLQEVSGGQSGRFVYQANQFGFQGAFYFARVNVAF
jgi:bifunctional non-homologous end joining protein LigD